VKNIKIIKFFFLISLLFLSGNVLAAATSNTFTSRVFDVGGKTSFGTIDWTAVEGVGATVSMRFRAGNVAVVDGTWTAWTSVSDGGSLAAFAGNRYFQYETTLNYTDSSITPYVQDVAVSTTYPTDFQKLVSSAYDSSNELSSVNKIQWTQAGTGTVQFQIRTAPDSSSNPDWANGSKWCGPTICAATTSDSDFAADYYTTADGSTTINSFNSDRAGDRWIQYAIFLKSDDGTATPIIQDVTAQFEFNNPPTISVTGSAQQSDGRVKVDYTMQETEITLGSGTYEQDTAYSSIFYQMDNLTLAQDVSEAGTESVVITNTNNVPIPSSGKVLIGTELIAYTSQTGNTTLSGITRSQDFYLGSNYRTESAAHTTGTAVYFLATNVSGQINNASLSAIDGLTKTAYWDAESEPNISLTGTKFTNVKIKVAANDNDAYGNRVGADDFNSAIEGDYENPTVTSATTTTASGIYGTGQTIPIQINFSENITSSTAINILLETGDTDYTCVINSITNATSGSCDYVVGAGQITNDLSITSVSGTIADQFGNSTSTLTIPGGQNISDSKNIVIDTIDPVVSFSEPIQNAHRNTGQIKFTLDENLTSGQMKFVSTTAVGAETIGGEHTYNLSGAELTTLTEQTKTVSGLIDGNTYSLVGNATDIAGNVADPVTVTGIVYDVTDPTVSIVSPSNDAFINNITDASDISYTTNENLQTGTYLKFTRTGGTVDGSSPRTCNLSGTELASGDHNDVDLNDVCGGFSLVDGAIYSIDFYAEDLATNNQDATQKTGITYDTTAPSLSSLTSTTDNTCGTGLACGTGEEINITAVYNENVAAGSTLTVRLQNTASPSVDVVLNQISGGEISGTYTILGPNLGHDTDDLNIASIVSENVTDVAGNTRTNSSLPSGENLADNKGIVIDTGPPTLDAFSAPSGNYNEGDSFTITADYSETLSTLNGGSSISVTFNSGETLTLSTISSDKLTGTYTVSAGENAESLQVSAINSQNAVDLIGNPLTTTSLPVTNISGVQVDTTAPVLGGTPIDIDVVGGKTSSPTVNINLSATDNFNLSDGFVQFSLNGGTGWCGQVAYASTVNFNIVSGSSACGGTDTLEVKTVTARFIDAAGNISSTASDTVEFDSEQPVLSSFSTTNSAGVYGPGEGIVIEAQYHEQISDGSITVNLNNGATVTLNTVSGDKISGTYTIGATGSGQDTADLEVSSIASESASDTSTPANERTNSAVPGTNISGVIVDTTAPEGSIVFDRSKDSGQVTINATDSNDTDMQTEVIVTADENDACSFAGIWISYADNINTNVTENSNSARKACVKFKDEAGNTSLTYSATTPETPESISYTDITNVDLEPAFYGTFLLWQIPTNQGSGEFSAYDIKYCSVDKDSSDCSPTNNLAEVTSVNQNYYTHNDLSGSNKYCYKIRFKDGNNNYSKYSDDYCTIPGEGTVATDTDVEIQDVSVGSVTDSAAQLSFMTVDAGDSDAALPTTVEVRVYSDETLTTQVGAVFTEDVAYSVNHLVRLTGLTSSTTYYLKVKATDTSIAGNANRMEEISYDVSVHPELAFTTTGALETITLVSDDVTTNSKAVIEFRTDQNAKCFIDYKRPTDAENEGTTTTETEFKKNHTITISDILFSDTIYEYDITCFDAGNVFVYLNDQEFETSDKEYSQGELEASGDTTDPEISSVSVSEIKGESAVVEWNTNEKANSLVMYSLDGSDFNKIAGDYEVLTSADNYATAHSVTLNDLIPSTKYSYSVISSDAAGNIAQSSQSSFTTKEPTSLSSVKVISKALGQATVTWETDAATTSVVEYGLTTSYGEEKESNTKIKKHELTISDLKSGETYHFRVKGEDADGNLFASNDNTFEPKSPPKISDFKIDEITEHGAKITFTTNVPTDTLVVYTDSEDEKNSGFQGKPEIATKHEIELKNLASGTEFGIKLKVRDEDSNETEEDFESFTTSTDTNAPKVDQVRTDSALTQADKVQAIISWKTDENANTNVIYREGKGGKENEVKVSDVMTTAHVAVITTFKPGTVYYFKVKSIDAAGNEGKSTDFALLTPRRKENIIQIIVNNFQDIFGWAQR